MAQQEISFTHFVNNNKAGARHVSGFNNFVNYGIAVDSLGKITYFRDGSYTHPSRGGFFIFKALLSVPEGVHGDEVEHGRSLTVTI